MLAPVEPDASQHTLIPSGCLCFSGAQLHFKAVPSLRLGPEQHKARKAQQVVAIAKRP